MQLATGSPFICNIFVELVKEIWTEIVLVTVACSLHGVVIPSYLLFVGHNDVFFNQIVGLKANFHIHGQ